VHPDEAGPARLPNRRGKRVDRDGRGVGRERGVRRGDPVAEELVFLARRLGFVATDWQQGATDLERDISSRMQDIHEGFLHRFGKHERLDR